MRDGKPHLLKMENDSTLLPSMLCAPTREAVSEWLYRHHDVPADDDETQALQHTDNEIIGFITVQHYTKQCYLCFPISIDSDTDFRQIQFIFGE